jgi:hypothetical protein
MAEGLSNLWKIFSLSEEESLEVEVFVQWANDLTTRGNSCLVDRLIADRVIGKKVLKSSLGKIWKSIGRITFTVLGENLFLVEFVNVCDKVRVLEGRPWVFEGSLFSVQNFNGSLAPTKMDFDMVSFRVGMFHLPLACMTETMGLQLGSPMGLVE